MTGTQYNKVGTWQRRVQRGLAAFVLPVATVLFTGGCLDADSTVPELSSEGGSGDASAGTAEADSLLLVNRTDTAFVALAFHPKAARPLKSKIEVDLGEKRASEGSSFYVAADDSTALWPCDSLDAYENYTLHLYRIPGGAQGVVQAPLARSVEVTPERLNAARRRSCRLEIGDL